MSDLISKKCQACVGIGSIIGRDDAIVYMKQLDNWELSEDGLLISKKFNFKNFKQTMFFINAVAFLCEQEGHHPDAKFSYNYCNISFTTHELGGLTENDFICAAKIDKLLNN